MKRKYCLIRNDGDLNPSSFVFVVWVGSSLRESTLLALVEEFCKDVGWYFKRWSPVVDSALEKRSRLSRVDGTKTVRPFSMMSITIDQCYHTIIDDSWVNLEASHVMTPQEVRQRFGNSPTYLLRFHNQRRKTACSPSKRKYLSHEKENVISGFAVPMMAIVALFILDALASHFISSLTF